MIEITQDVLHKLFIYRDGCLYRKITRGPMKAGSRAGSVDPRGYSYININGKNYLEHRLIFMMHHGFLPKFIDHIDTDKSNSRIENLRQATGSQNQWNRGAPRNNALGIKGVRFHKGKFLAHITVNKIQKHLGCFDTPEDAHEAYCSTAQLLRGEFANTGVKK